MRTSETIKRVRLGEVFDLQMGKTPARADSSFWGGGHKWISIADIGKADVYISETKETISDAAISASGIRPIPKDTLIMSFKLSIGKVAITAEEMFSNEAIMSFRDLGKHELDLHYLFHQFKNKDWSGGMNKAVMGATLNKASLKCHEILLHPLPVQRRIAAALDKISEMKRNAEARLQKLDLLVKARFVKIFGDVKECCVRWGFEKLSKYCDLQNGYAFKSEDYVAESLVRNCRMSNIRPDATFDAEYHPKFLPNEYWDEFSSYRVSDGDVLIAMTDMATAPKILGVPTIVRTNGHRFLLNQRVGKLSFYHGLVIDKVFLMYYLATPFIRRQLARNAGGGLQINVGKPAIMGLEIPTPPLSLQRSFAAFVEKVDALKATAQASLARVDLLYRAKLQEYFG